MKRNPLDPDLNALIDAFEKVKQVKPEDLFSYVLLTDYGVTAPEVEKLIRQYATNFKFPHEIDDNDISDFFGKQNWKTMTVKLFWDCCVNLIGYKRTEDL